METHQQRFNGENFYNNRVDVDFKKKTVVFEPVQKGGYIRFHFHLFSTMLIGILLGVYMPFIGVYSIVFILILGFESASPYILFMIVLIVMIAFIFSAVFSLNFYSKKFRNDHLPKMYAGISLLMNGYKHRYKTITPDSLVMNKFVLPRFSNVVLDYDAHGDMAVKLKRIYIKERFKGYDMSWFCVIEFKSKPKDGEMNLRYI